MWAQGRHHLTITLELCVCPGGKDIKVSLCLHPGPPAPGESPLLHRDLTRPSRCRVAPESLRETDPSEDWDLTPSRVDSGQPHLPGLDRGMTRGKWRREGLRGLRRKMRQHEATG